MSVQNAIRTNKRFAVYYAYQYSMCVYCGENISFKYWLACHKYGECKQPQKKGGD